MKCAIWAALLAEEVQLNQPDQPLIRVNVDLVQFDVIVADSKGNHVADLKAEEFEVLENGRPQRITHLSFVPGVRSSTTAESRTRQSPSIAPTSIRPEQITRTLAVVIDDPDLPVFPSPGKFPEIEYVEDQLDFVGMCSQRLGNSSRETVTGRPGRRGAPKGG